MLNIEIGMVIHCKTEEEARLFAKLSGAQWNDSLHTSIFGDERLERYGEMTCYRRNKNGRYNYASLSHYEEEGWTVTEFSNLLTGTIFGNGLRT